MQTRHRTAALVGSLVLLLPLSALAQSARSGGSSSANTQALQQLQQLGSERTALKAENDRMKRELEALRKERDALKAGQQGTGARVQAAQAALSRSTREQEATQNELTQLKSKMQELIAKFRETAQTLKDVESDRTTARQTLAQRDQELKVCADHNMELYKINNEVLTRIDKRGPLSCVAGAEPFTRIQRTRMENLIDEYRARAEDQRVTSK